LLSYFTRHPDIEKSGKVKSFYCNLSNPIESATGEVKYEHLSALALNLLTIPASIADCDSVQPGAEDQNKFLV